MSTVNPRSKRHRRMSRRQQRALGLPSDSDSSRSSSSSDGVSDDGSCPSTPSQATSNLQTQALERSQSSASSTSRLSIPANPPTLLRSQSTANLALRQQSGTIRGTRSFDQRQTFDKRYETATMSDGDVLRSSSLHPFPNHFLTIL